MSTLLQELSANQEAMKTWRHHMHRHPEVAFDEHKTASYIAGLLREWGYEVTEGVGKTGVVARMRCGDSKKSIGLRADTDALAVQEANDSDHKSTIEGKSHTCGHDGHSAMLLGAAQHLARTRAFNGTVNLIFQPAEEIMGGAVAMIQDGLFERFPMDAVFGMHNMPALEQGKMYFTSGPLFAAVDNWEIVLTGVGSHGSMPEKSIDPVVAGASLVMALQTIVSRNVDPMQPAVVTVGALHAGVANNVIPASARLEISLRALDPQVRRDMEDRIKTLIELQARSFGVRAEIDWRPGYAVLVNDSEQTGRALGVAQRHFPAEQIVADGPMLTGSEDFAFMLERVPGCYLFIGNGAGGEPGACMVHNPAYDFNDAALPLGASFFVRVVERKLAA